MTTDVWNPERYERFRDERRQPFFDLLALVRPRPGMRVVDLARYRDRLLPRLPDRRPYFFTFQRILLWGHL